MVRPAAILLAGVISAGLAPPIVDRGAPPPVTNISREELAKLPIPRGVEDLLKVCPARTIPTVGDPAMGGTVALPTTPPSCVQPDDLRMIEIYRAHNFARTQVGAAPLVWDRQLERDARLYAQQMAQTGQLLHSSRDNRKLVRENLMRVPRGWSPQRMMGLWLGERQNLVPGSFPNVSRTGNWGDIAHYTQMVWPTTTSIGCAIQPGGAFDWVICRYSPPGNRDGTAIGAGGVILAPKRADVICVGQGGGVMMCPGPGEGKQQAGPGGKKDGSDAGQGGNNGDNPTTRERPTEPAATADDGIGRTTGNCGISIIAKVRIVERGDPDQPNRRRRTKESHNLDHGFDEIVIPDGWDAVVDLKPDPNPAKTSPAPGKMTATWSIAGQPNPHQAVVTGDYAKLRTGRWDRETGFMNVSPTDRPAVQQHRIDAEWDPTPPTDPDKCTMDKSFMVTFAAPIPDRPELDLKNFVEQAGGTNFPGTRERQRTTTGTRAFHEAHPQTFSRNNNVVVPIGIYWDLPANCCDIRPSVRKVIQFARAAIHGPNGRQGKGWGLDILPSEFPRAPGHNPTYTGNPRSDGNETPTPGGAGGTRAMGDNVLQWDAPGMPKDLYDRLFAAQGASVYRQQFLSLLVCRPPGTTTVRANLASARICRVSVTTVRWDFSGQAGITPVAPRPGARPEMPYRQPTISISFDVRDGHCASLRAFLDANGLLAAFEHPGSDARNLEILPPGRYADLDTSVTNWEANPFADVRFP